MKDGSLLKYDFLILCNGLYHVPYIPTFKGQEHFKGTIVHSTMVSEAKSIAHNKKVIVVGGNKSAFDMVKIFSKFNPETTLASRRNGLSMEIQEKVLGINLFDLMFSRVSYLFFYLPHGEVPFFSFWPWICKKYANFLVGTKSSQ